MSMADGEKIDRLKMKAIRLAAQNENWRQETIANFILSTQNIAHELKQLISLRDAIKKYGPIRTPVDINQAEQAINLCESKIREYFLELFGHEMIFNLEGLDGRDEEAAAREERRSDLSDLSDRVGRVGQKKLAERVRDLQNRVAVNYWMKESDDIAAMGKAIQEAERLESPLYVMNADTGECKLTDKPDGIIQLAGGE